MGFLSFLSAIISFIGSFMGFKRDNALRDEGKLAAGKEIAESGIKEIKRRTEAVSEVPDKSYDGDIIKLRNFVRSRNKDN